MEKVPAAEPQAAFDLLQKYLDEHEVSPQVAWMFRFDGASMLYDKMSDKPRALAMVDDAINTVSKQVEKKQAPMSRLLLLLGLKGRFLVFDGKPKEAETLLQANWQNILTGAKSEDVDAIGVASNAA